jgi:hypothetical protein
LSDAPFALGSENGEREASVKDVRVAHAGSAGASHP